MRKTFATGWLDGYLNGIATGIEAMAEIIAMLQTTSNEDGEVEMQVFDLTDDFIIGLALETIDMYELPKKDADKIKRILAQMKEGVYNGQDALD